MWDSLVLLLAVVADIYNLQDVVVGAELQSTHVDLDILLQEVFRQLAHLLGPGGAPHEGLTVRLGGGGTGCKLLCHTGPLG